MRVLQWIAASLLLASSVAHAASWETRANELLQAGKAAEAFEWLQTQSAEYGGDPEFDLLLATTATQAGYPDQARFALERVLIVQPQNHFARLKLAQAYLALGDYDSARRELATLRTGHPPADIDSAAERLSAEMDRQDTALKTRQRAYLDLKFGSDSNVSSATSAASVTLPGGQVILLNDESQQRDDGFMESGLGASIEQPLSPTQTLFFSVSASQRNNFQEKAFNTRLLGLKTGLSLVQGQHQFRLSLQFDEYDVADRALSRFRAISPEWSRAVSAQDWISAYGQVGRLAYSGQSSRDMDTLLLGGGWTHRFSTYGGLLNLGVYYGNDDAKNDKGKFYGRDYYGVNLGLRWNPFPRHTPYITLIAQKTDFDATHPDFAQTRSDDLYQATLGWRWQPEAAWSFNAEARYNNNSSIIPLFDYDRTLLTLGARYDFN